MNFWYSCYFITLLILSLNVHVIIVKLFLSNGLVYWFVSYGIAPPEISPCVRHCVGLSCHVVLPCRTTQGPPCNRARNNLFFLFFCIFFSFFNRTRNSLRVRVKLVILIYIFIAETKCSGLLQCPTYDLTNQKKSSNIKQRKHPQKNMSINQAHPNLALVLHPFLAKISTTTTYTDRHTTKTSWWFSSFCINL
jgi:hypothetical protein